MLIRLIRFAASATHFDGHLPLTRLPVRGLVDRRGRLGQRRVAKNDVGGLLGEHDGRAVQVATDDVRHDRRVDNAQVLQPVDASLRVDNRVVALAHAVGARRVVGALRVLAHPGVDLRVRLHRLGRRDGVAAVLVEDLLLEDLARQANRRANVHDVLVRAQIVGLEDRVLTGVGAAKLQVATTRRAHRRAVSLHRVLLARSQLAGERARQKVVLEVRVALSGGTEEHAVKCENTSSHTATLHVSPRTFG